MIEIRSLGLVKEGDSAGDKLGEVLIDMSMEMFGAGNLR